MTTAGTWLLLMIWTGTGSGTGGASGPNVVPFESEAVCRLVGTQYEERYSRATTRWPAAVPAVRLVEWKCVFNGN